MACACPRPNRREQIPMPKETLMRCAGLSSLLAIAMLSGACAADGGKAAELGGDQGADAGAGEEGGLNGSAGNGATGSGTDPEGDPDEDTIRNADEGSLDTDGDGTGDDQDEDSDGDGLSDADEAGDDALGTPPRDTDQDGKPDFQDADSDGDGVADASERMRGLDPIKADSDGDGADDLTEIAAGTDPLDDSKNPTAEGNFFFRVPFEAPPDPLTGALLFEPAIRAADVYFMMDSSVSMAGEIDAVKDNLANNILPGVLQSIADVQVGAGEFDQCPEKGGANNVGVRNVASATTDAASVATAMSTISANGGSSEPYGIAMWLWATGDVAPYPALAASSCAAGLVGYGCVRSSALPILVMIGDEPYQQGDGCDAARTPGEVGDALNAIGAKLVVMGPTAKSKSSSRERWLEIANRTGSLDDLGQPLFFATENASALEDDDGTLVVAAIEKLANGVPLELTAAVRDAPGDKIDAVQFIERVDALAAGGIAEPRRPNVFCVGGLDTSDRDANTHDEFFDAVRPGTPVCFELIVKMNTQVEPLDTPQVLKAFVDVRDSFGRVFDTREIFFLVPPAPPEVGGVPF